jgi:putative ABC transport system substrate-binding protein
MARLALLLAVFTLAVAPGVAAQPARAAVRIGVLDAVSAEANAENLDALRQGLRELGYVEGQGFALEYRSADDRPERFPDLARELVALKVDVIVTRGEFATLAAKQATATIPILMAAIGDPTISGLVPSLTRPGGNVTGFHVMVPPELGGQRLRLLREVVPALTRVGILWNPSDLYPPAIVTDTQKTAAALGVQLESLEVARPEAFEKIFETALFGRIDAVIAVEDLLMFTERARIVDFAAMSRLPGIYGRREFVDAGGLMAYGTDRRDLFRRCAGYIDRILKGARPGDLPIEAPTKYELAINLKTATRLGLTIPPSLLQRADHVVR